LYASKEETNEEGSGRREEGEERECVGRKKVECDD